MAGELALSAKSGPQNERTCAVEPFLAFCGRTYYGEGHQLAQSSGALGPGGGGNKQKSARGERTDFDLIRVTPYSGPMTDMTGIISLR